MIALSNHDALSQLEYKYVTIAAARRASKLLSVGGYRPKGQPTELFFAGVVDDKVVA